VAGEVESLLPKEQRGSRHPRSFFRSLAFLLLFSFFQGFYKSLISPIQQYRYFVSYFVRDR
jgi:hypothetical protein